MWIRRSPWRTWIMAGALAPGVTAMWGSARAHDDKRPEQFLYVWAGDQARTSPDRLAVVDFDPSSSTYGRIVTTRPLPGPGASGNEPHHVGLSSDGRTLALGGLLERPEGPERHAIRPRFQRRVPERSRATARVGHEVGTNSSRPGLTMVFS
jgi:hypothetical protein